MIKNIVTYYDQAQQAMETAPADHKLTWTHIRNQTQKQFDELSQMKFKDPKSGEEVLTSGYKNYNEEILNSFKSLNENIL